MKDNILLIQPRNTLALNVYPPLNLIQLGSELQAEGYRVKIITCPILENHIEVILQECSNAFLVGITALTSEIPDAVHIATQVKKSYNIPIVWGGWHATLFPEQMASSKLVDKVIIDEGDKLIVSVADEYKNKNGKNSNTNKILSNAGKVNMDESVLPDYSLVPDLEKYMASLLVDKFLAYDDRRIRWLPYQASRGCPGKCAFCINVVTDNRKYRRKSAGKVVEEIESITHTYKINHLKIIDDNFFVHTGWVEEIADNLIKKNLNITWDAECRVDYYHEKKVNDKLLEKLVQSGLNELNFGIESGSENTLRIMKKGITPEQSLYAVSKNAQFGIVSRCSFIIDVPGEKKDILQTAALVNKIRKIPKTTCGVHTYRPYPKSELCEGLIRDGRIKQPATLEEWANKKHVAQFTYADAKKKMADKL